MIEVAITDVCDFQGGTQPPKNEWSSVELPGYIRMLQIRDFTQAQERHIEYVKNKSTLKLCSSEDILIGRYGASVGKILTGLTGAYNVALVKTIPDKNKLDRGFLLHLLRGRSFQSFILNVGSRAAQAGFNKEDLKKFKFLLPTLIEQQKIAAILDAADSLRQKDQQLVEHYTALSKSLFLEMFGDPVTNPMGWNIEAFDKLVASDCPLTYGIVQPGDELTEGTAIVRPVDLVERYIKINSLKKIAPEISQKFERTILKGGELLLSVRGSVGAMSIALPELRGANVTRGIVPIWMNTEKMTNEFAINLLQSNQVQKKLKDSSKGATLVQLNLKDLREMQLICPPIVLQKTFTERIQLIEAQKHQAQRSLEKSEALFNSLLQRAFTGELTAKMAA